ncbi:CHAT domain-containing protein [Nonomuraea sp. MTCD27]|uniref:CHAT domain-containing protein n=1 Tax=Nonomuraea sp. MTCD27 TaxID=1676747 RepID=UPI0035BFF4C6
MSDSRERELRALTAAVTAFQRSGNLGDEVKARQRRAGRLTLWERYDEAAEEFARLAASQRLLGLRVEVGISELACAESLSRAGKLDESLAHFSAAADCLDRHGSVEERAVAHDAWLATVAQQGDRDTIAARCEVILELAPERDDLPLLRAARLRAVYHKARLLAAPDEEEDVDRLSAAEPLARAVIDEVADNPAFESRAIEGQMRMIIGRARQEQGDLAAASSEFALVAEIGLEQGLSEMSDLGMEFLGRALREVPDLGVVRFSELAERHRRAGQRHAEAVCRYQRAQCLERTRISPWSLEAAMERAKIGTGEAERAGEIFDTLGLVRKAGDAYYQAGHMLSQVCGFEEDQRPRCVEILETASQRFAATEAWWVKGLAEHLAAFVIFMHPPMPSGEERSLAYLHRSIDSFQRGDRPLEEATSRLEIAVQIGLRGEWTDDWLDAIFTWLRSHELARSATLLAHRRQDDDRRTAQMLTLVIGHLQDAAATCGGLRRWQEAIWGAAQAVKGRAFLDQQVQHEAWSHLLAVDPSLRELTGQAEMAMVALEQTEWNLQSALFTGDMERAQRLGESRDAAQQALRTYEHEQRERLDQLTRDQPDAMQLVNSEPVDPSEIQAVLRPGELYLEYLWRYGHLVRFAITADRFDIAVPDPNRMPFLTWVREASKLARHGTEEGMAANPLFMDALLGPIPAKVNTLIICPQGELAATPWHLLPFEDTTVGDRFSTSVVPAAGSFLRLRGSPPRAADAGYLGVAYNARARTDLSYLPGVDREVTMIAQQHFGDDRGSCLTSADSDTFLGLRRSVELLHVASHANRHGLHLSTTVTPVDLLDLKIRADILLLTGCEAGDFAGEDTNEFLGIVRQLLIVTHARAAIVSIAAVSEKAAPTFSDLVVAALLGHAPAAPVAQPARSLAVGAATRWARQELRRMVTSTTGSRADPLWWSPWFVVGDPAAVLTARVADPGGTHGR